MRSIDLFARAWILLFAWAGSVSASASSSLTDSNFPRPKALQCTSSSRSSVARFTLSAFDSMAPVTDLDARADTDEDGRAIDSNPFTTRFCATNGCDNSYCFVFQSDDLSLLASGKLNTTKGLLNYYDSDTRESTEPRTVIIECKTTVR